MSDPAAESNVHSGAASDGTTGARTSPAESPAESPTIGIAANGPVLYVPLSHSSHTSPSPKTGNSVTGGYPISTSGRWLLFGWSLFLLGGFLLSSRLQPDPRGFGTHEGLGLPPCTFRLLAGLPCPSCGMTTSFANFVRGEWTRALHANAGGVFLALVCVMQIPWCASSAFRGRLLGVAQPTTALAWLLAAILAVCGANWIFQLSFG
jgi:Protein of unknown function (DUF2752)